MKPIMVVCGADSTKLLLERIGNVYQSILGAEICFVIKSNPRFGVKFMAPCVMFLIGSSKLEYIYKFYVHIYLSVCI